MCRSQAFSKLGKIENRYTLIIIVILPKKCVSKKYQIKASCSYFLVWYLSLSDEREREFDDDNNIDLGMNAEKRTRYKQTESVSFCVFEADKYFFFDIYIYVIERK